MAKISILFARKMTDEEVAVNLLVGKSCSTCHMGCPCAQGTCKAWIDKATAEAQMHARHYTSSRGPG